MSKYILPGRSMLKGMKYDMIENLFMALNEIKSGDYPLLKLAKETPDKVTDLKELDKPFKASENKEKTNADASEKKSLTNEEKAKIREESGWSNEIVDRISSMEEYEVYKKAGLKEVEINGKPALVRQDIDLDKTDDHGRTNKARMDAGLPPLTNDGKTLELHHIGQKGDSPLAELTMDEHRGKGNDSILHDKTKESEIDRTKFNDDRTEHWKQRAA